MATLQAGGSLFSYFIFSEDVGKKKHLAGYADSHSEMEHLKQ